MLFSLLFTYRVFLLLIKVDGQMSRTQLDNWQHMPKHFMSYTQQLYLGGSVMQAAALRTVFIQSNNEGAMTSSRRSMILCN